MSEIVPIVPGKGNTKPSPKQCNACKRWCFTWNNYPDTGIDDCIKAFSANSSKYCIGKEVGEQGTPHLQGYVSCDKKIRWTAFDLPKTIHWEKAKGDEDSNYTYCGKEGNMISNIKKDKPLICLADEKLTKWQREVVEIVKKDPNDRTIYWYWEPVGNMGKTTFAKYLSIKYNAIPIEGKKNDILFCAAMFPSDLYIFDFERSMEEFISYGAMEKIKNGYYMSAKYESKPIIRNPPHLICFANFEPDLNKLSKDRWVIVEIKEKIV